MPRANPFDKKTSTTYALVSRPQNDALIHDSSAPSQIFTEVAGPSRHVEKSKIKQRGDLEEEFGLQGTVRDNEGEAAEHGIFFDDSSYDYMQHMKDLGENNGGTTTWVEAPQSKHKGKGKQNLEDAMRDMKLGQGPEQARLDDTIETDDFMGKRKAAVSYQEQQDIPDAIAGFQPEMDPRLREVLEALDDEAYVDDEEGTFAELTNEREEVDQYEWEATGMAEEDGWDSDDTTKPFKEYNDVQDPGSRDLIDLEKPAAKGIDTTLPSLIEPKLSHPRNAPSDIASNASILTAGRRKKRKGALTSSTNFSMTSSAIARTEPLSLLDARFEKITESYLNDIDEDDDHIDLNENMSLASGMTTNSNVTAKSNFTANSMASKRSVRTSRDKEEDEGPPRLTSAGFQSVMDDFLGPPKSGKERKMKKGGKVGTWGSQSGIEQLDEIRKSLGPARIQSSKSVAQYG